MEATGAATADGTNAEQSTCDGANHQTLDFLPVNGQVNVFRLRVREANKCLQIPTGVTTPGADIELASCADVTNQHFELFAQADGSYRIQVKHSNLFLGLASESTAPGIQLEQQASSASTAQNWRLANHDFSDPSVNGRWGEVIPWPHIAVSAANLPDGRILTFSGSERETWPTTERTYSATWNPKTGEFLEQTHIGHNMFCAHLAMAADGQVFVNGGRNQTNSPWTSLFQFQDNQWTQIENMTSGGRWYPTTLALADGDMFTAIGTASNQRNPDRWDAEDGWRTMTGINFQEPVLDYGSTHGEHRWWPLLHLAPQGKIFHSGPTPTMGWINTTGNGAYEDTGIRKTEWYHKHGTSIMYDEGKILNAGGWTAGNSTTSTNRAFTVDLTGPSPVVAETGGMVHSRKFHNGIMSPLGDVFVLGGNTSGAKFSDNGRILSAESWDPDTGNWTEHAEMSVPRNYHSIALLLTDGRMLAAGSGYCSGNRYCSGASHRDGQVYEPAYLFNADGSYATRPVIESGPGFVGVGSVFTLNTDSPVSYFSMIKMGATTHGMNTDVRFLRPEMTDLGGNSYQVTANGNPNVLTPGYWMVFAVNAQGVPSEAHVVRITTPDVDFDNVALGGSVSQSSTSGAQSASLAIDGDMTATATSIAQTNSETNAWWQLDLNSVYSVDSVRLWNRTDCCTDELSNAYVLISDEPFVSDNLSEIRAQDGVTEYYVGSAVIGTLDITIERTARFIRVQRDGSGPLSLAEVQVFGDPPGAGTPGLVHYDYYEGTFASLPNFNALTPVRSGTVDGFRLSPASAADGFALRFYGQLNIAASGLYTFYTESSDGSRLLIDGIEVVNNDGTHAAIEAQGSISLEPGSHDIVVEYFDNAAAESLLVSFEGPGLAKQPIPTSALALLPDPTGTGEVLREWWSGVSGTSVASLTGLADYPDNPTGQDVRPLFEAPINWADNYGTRMRGFLHPPMSGYYTFWISSDDGGELWLSTDEQPSNANLIANVPGWSSSRQFDKFAEQQSVSIFLQRGNRYYIEALQKEQGGGDNLAVAWRPPFGVQEVIGGEYLSQFTTPLQLITVDAPPQVSTGDVTMTAYAEGDALLYSWSPGDGSPDSPQSSDPSFTHNYSAPGRYTASVTITDILGNTITEVFQQIVHNPLTANRPNASSSVVYHGDRAEVWNVNPDNNSVTAIDANADALITEIPVGDNPRSLAVAADWQIWVTNKDDGTISIIDPSTQSVSATIDVGTGTQPHGIVADPASAAIYVALQGTGEVAKFDAYSQVETARAFVGTHVKHMSVNADGSQIYASLFITPPVPGESTNAPVVAGQGGVVRVLDSSLSSIAPDILLGHSNQLPSEHSGPGLPNYLGAATVSPDGLTAWIPSKQDNILRGQIRNGLPLVHDQTVRAISSKIDLVTLGESLSSRVDHDNASVPTSAVFDPYGTFMYTALEGNRQIAISDTYQSSEILRFNVGRAPQGLAISPSGDKLFVHNFMDRSITIHDLTSLHNNGTLNVPLTATIPTVAAEALTADVLIGKQFFYDSSDDRMAAEDYMSCASCHNEGSEDGRTWDFTQFGEGVRNTITLNGRGIGHGRVHWSANFDEIQDFEGQIRTFALGTGLMSDADFMTGTRSQSLGDPKAGISAELDALAAYVNSLTEVPDSAYRMANGDLTPDAAIGRDAFLSLDCGSCHSGNELTDSASDLLHDVGTIGPFSGSRMGVPLTDTGLDTPSLLVLSTTAPYLHDGSAATVKDAILAHTNVSVLESEAEDIATFLMQADPADLVIVTANVPDVANQPQAAAETQITAAGFVVGVIDNQYSDTVTAGSVISQDPLAGTEVPVGSPVNLVISDGPIPMTDVPNLVGLTQVAAQSALSAVGLGQGAVTTAYSDTIPLGSVVSHNPAAGESVLPGSTIDLVISDGPEPPVSVPDLAGLSQSAAQTTLTGLGLNLGAVTSDYSETVAAGLIISQNPAAGSDLAVGGSVDIVVSDGPAPVTVPDVGGLDQSTAEGTLTALGLGIGMVTSQYSETVPSGSVISQLPVAGTEVSAGSSVDLVVSDGPAPVLAPSVTNLTLSAAETQLISAALSLGTVTNSYSDTVIAGNVISQSPSAGTPVLPGSAVDLVISDGPEPVLVPAVTGLPQASAETAISSAGLTLGTVDTTYSASISAGDVINQSPDAGTSVLPGTSVDLTVSIGPEPILVPGVVGETQADASSAIVLSGLTLGSINTVYSETIPAGEVISQSPDAGTSVQPGTAVNLVVSDGPAPITVPGVVGQTQTAAESTITAAGLSVGSVSTSHSDTVAAGNVISQSPAGGTTLLPGGAVDLVVSIGPEPVSVPGVVGQTQLAAESAISAAGLSVGSVNTAYSASVPAGNVISQNPAPGTSVLPGTAVDLVVSDGPEPAVVPGVINQPQSAAEASIVAAGLTVGSVTTAYSETVAAGNVVSQSPSGGSSLLPGSPVDLVISDGPAPVIVPGVVGQPQTSAESAIIAVGLSVGSVSSAYSASIPSGSVVSQSPIGGTSVLPGGSVDLVISDGPAPIPVPGVIGQSQSAAETSIVTAGLSIGTISFAYSASVAVGDVISQSPDAGSSVLPGTAVDLVVSQGPEPTGPNLQRGSVSNVSSDWQTVTLPSSYSDMVVIATPEYGKTDLPVVTRIRNAAGNSFELRVQNPSDTPVSGYTVRYLVAQAGVYNSIDHGLTMEAVKTLVAVTDEDASWTGEAQVYANSYTSPVVLGQVMSSNDDAWSVFWASDGNVGNPPSPTALSIGKHVAEDSNVTRAPETIGYIVVEAGVGSYEGLAYAAGVGADIVEGVTESPAPYTYPLGFFADSAVLSSAGMDGTNGGWPVLHSEQSLPASQLGMGIDEDQIGDSERIRTTDQVAYLAFGELVTGPSPSLHSGVVDNVGDSWITVTLPTSYTDMVVIATPEYSAADLPAVTRIRAASGNQFDVRVQNPSGTPLAGYRVRYLVAEAGVYTGMSNGIQMEVVKYNSSRVDENNAWVGDSRSYQNAYNNPVVLGQVMTSNSDHWSTFWSSNGNRSTPPTASSLVVGKHVGEDTNLVRADETIGYIVIEAGMVNVDGMMVSAGLTADNIRGITDSGQPYTNNVGLVADNIVLSGAAMDGVNGGWPILDASATVPGSSIGILYDEDQVGDSERAHTTEQAAFVATQPAP